MDVSFIAAITAAPYHAARTRYIWRRVTFQTLIAPAGKMLYNPFFVSMLLCLIDNLQTKCVTLYQIPLIFLW